MSTHNMHDKIVQIAFQQIADRLRSESVADELLIPSLFFLTKGFEDVEPLNYQTTLLSFETPKQNYTKLILQLNATKFFYNDFSDLIKIIPPISEAFFLESYLILERAIQQIVGIDGYSFMKVLTRNGRLHKDFHFTPEFAAERIAEIIGRHIKQNHNNASLLDLGAGFAVLTNTIRKGINTAMDITAVEIAPSISALGKMHLLLDGMTTGKLVFLTKDVCGPLGNKKYDYVVSDLPVGRFRSDLPSVAINANRTSRLESLFIEKGLSKLKDRGLVFIRKTGGKRGKTQG